MHVNNFTISYKNKESSGMVCTIRSRLAKQRNPTCVCLNGLTNGFKMIIQLLRLVAAEDLAGRRCLERVAGCYHGCSPLPHSFCRKVGVWKQMLTRHLYELRRTPLACL